jgi:hypothetical protein
MSTQITPTSELQAVNAMLGAIGMAPLNSLNDAATADVVTARRMLMQESLALQAKGWHFNTEYDYPLVRDMNQQIRVPANVLRVDLDQSRFGGRYDIVQRGQRVYDKRRRSYQFDENLKAVVVLGLPFEELPQSARWYVTVRAARKFQDELVGDDSQHSFKERDEFDAWAAFKEFEGDTADHSIFDNYDTASIIIDRGGPMRWND